MQDEDGGAASQSHDSSVSVAGSAGNLPKSAISLCPDLSLFLHPPRLCPTFAPVRSCVCSGSLHAFVAVPCKIHMQ